MPKLYSYFCDDNSPCDEGNRVEDKHKEIIGTDDGQLSGGVEIKLTSSNEVIVEFDNHQPCLRIYDPLRMYMEEYQRLVPERGKAKEKETEASFPQAWSMIDFPNFKPSLDEKMFCEGSGLQLLRLIDLFGTAFSGVSFAWEDISKDPLSSTLDVSLCPGYPKLVDWIVNDGPTLSLLGDFTVWSFGHILDSLFHYRWEKGHSPTHLSDVSIFSALALVLRSCPDILPMNFQSLNEIYLGYQEKGAVTCPIRVWMIYQVSYCNIHAALFSWVHFLLPQLQVSNPPHSRKFILQLVEKIFEKPGAQTQLVESPTFLANQLLPHNLFEILLRVTFPATSSATEEDTRRLLKVYSSLKHVALAGALKHKRLPRNMFSLSLRLAGEGNPFLSKEAIEIAIWSMKNVDCGEDWYDLCIENLEASVALLKTLPENEKLNLNLLPSSNKEVPDFIQQIFTVSLRLAGKGNPVLAKEAIKVSIWCLTQNVNSWSPLGCLYKKNLESTVALLKSLVDEWPHLSLKLSSSTKHFMQQIFTVSLGLAGEENPVLAKEGVEIAIWSLTENVDCWTCWKRLCTNANPEASVVLLKTLVEKWNVHSLELSSQSIETMKKIIHYMVTSSIRIAREGISILDTVVPGNPVLLGQASEVAIWSLIEIVDCSKRWDGVYRMILDASASLLQNLVKKCKDLSLRLASSPGDTLGGAPESEAMKLIFQQIFTFSLRLAGKESPVLTREAVEISMWSLTKNFDCWKHWDHLYKENIKASVALLKKLAHEWNGYSLKLSLSLPSDSLTPSQTIKSFRLKNQTAIADGGANVNLCEEADKFCKVISGRLSRGSCFSFNGECIIAGRLFRGSCSLDDACVTAVFLVAALVLYSLKVGIWGAV